MSNLAVLGGEPHIKKGFQRYNPIGREEVASVTKVVESGDLSSFLGAWGESFDGGTKVKEFESAWCGRFGVKHAVSVNSATSGLFAAVGAIGTSPGDEIIVPPYTMSATVMAPLVYGGIPVFTDVEDNTFCIDVERVEKAINAKTKAIIAVNLFGHSAELLKLRQIADKKGIYLIEDSSQAPLASENGRLAGTVGHIGVFSLNYHKHIHTGEGGVCVTDSDELALRMRLIRNHGENATEPALIDDLTNLIGYNYRLTEVAAAIGIEQLKKVDALVDRRESAAIKLCAALSDVPGLVVPEIREGCRHVFYAWPAKYYEQVIGVPRDVVIRALGAEGLGPFGSYVKPLYLLPVFQKRIAIGKNGFPFNLSDVTYSKGMCPVTERLYEDEMLAFPICAYDLDDEDIEQIAEGIRKVFSNKDELAEFARDAQEAYALPV